MESEFKFLKWVRKKFPNRTPDLLKGIGDDCAFFKINRSQAWAVSTDSFLEGIHFRRSWARPFQIGRKAFAVNLSDLAAKGAQPLAAFVCLSIPKNCDTAWVKGLYSGIAFESKRWSIPVAGGDLTRSSSKVFLSLSVIGRVNLNSLKLRSRAKSGDIVCVTGYLGDSSLGLRLLRQKRSLSSIEKCLVTRHLIPEPHLREGQWLASKRSVHAMMDLSDGLVSDLQRIKEESRCGFSIDVDQLPRSPQLQIVKNQTNDVKLKAVLAGGEDYCLLVTVAPSQWKNISKEYKHKFGRFLFPIGRVTSTRTIVYTTQGQRLRNLPKPFSHFAS